MLTFDLLPQLRRGQYGVDHLLDEPLAPELPGKIIVDDLLGDLVDVGISRWIGLVLEPVDVDLLGDVLPGQGEGNSEA